MENQYKADFVTAEEYNECVIAEKPFKSKALVNYLMVEPIEYTPVFRATFLFRHFSLYNLQLGYWVPLNEGNLRDMTPIIEYTENRKPFYVVFAANFYKVTEIRVNKENDLEFFLQQMTGAN